ncbi:ABC transporter ATP-binding protein [Pseudothermotoga sp.]|uniref:ABC transporter ATP-binding protein n=1 Tax=Pseudothermotoga sp. TaxID=2033661 RepID=UPI0031F60B0B
MNGYYVEVKNLVKIFKDPATRSVVRAVDGVSFGVEKGKLVTLLGPSGCGKTTTLRLIGGFEIPTSGDILIDGSVVNDLPPNRRPTAMVFQSYALFPHLNVFENVAYGLKARRVPKDILRRKVMQILEIVGLVGLEKRYPSQLSGGQQQRVALARALVVEPKVLLLDEPLSNLDAKLREQMRVELRKIQMSLGITSVYVTHDQLEAMTLSDYVIVMKDGKIVQKDTPEMLYRFPTNVFVASFIGKASFVEGKIFERKQNEAIVELKDGQRITIDVREDSNVQLNDSVLLVLRPEGGRFVSPQEGLLKGKVVTRVYTGSTFYFEIKTEHGTVSVEIHGHEERKVPQLGETVNVSFERSSMSVVKRE